MLRANLSGLITLLLLFSSARGQTPVIQWQKTLGSFNGDYVSSIRSTSDGGFIAAGYTEGKDGDVEGYHGNIIVGDVWITKLDGKGALQWEKCLGGTYSELNGTIMQTLDGGYILAASSASVDCGFPKNHGGLDDWLVKLSPTGDIQWQVLLGGSGNEYAWSMSPSGDGGYFIGGSTTSSDGQVTGYHSSGSYSFDWWVIKVDGLGNLVWQKTLGGTGDDQCFGVHSTPDGGCIAVGYVSSSDGDGVGNHGGEDVMMAKFDPNGNVQWKKLYGGSSFEEGWSVLPTADGGYIFGGWSGSDDGDVSGNHVNLNVGFRDFWVVKTDGNGVIQWQKCYGGGQNEMAYCMQPTADGGYMLAGSSESNDGDLSCNAGITDAWVIKIDGSGLLQWSKSMGGSLYDEGMALEILADGSVAVGANTCSVEVPGLHVHHGSNGTCDDYWIIKLTAPAASPPPATVVITPASGVVCAGMQATFTAIAQNTGVSPSYQWTKNGVSIGGNSPTLSASNFSNNDVVAVSVQSGTGVCDVSNGTATASVTVHANPNILHPAVKITSNSTLLCNCAPVTFSVSVTGGGSEPAYQWMINGVVQGTNNESFLSSSLNPSDVVTLQYFDSSGCVANAPVVSNPISLTQGTSGAVLSLTVSQSPDSVCAGTPITFTANPVNGGANPAYQWQLNGSNVGADSSTFTSASLANGDLLNCIVTADPAFSCLNSGLVATYAVIVHLAAKSNPLVAVTASSSQICKGSEADFTATSQGAGANPSYAWEVNGVPNGVAGPRFSGQNFANWDIIQCVVTIDPSFSCALTNTATSAPVVLSVINQPNPTISITGTPGQVCKGGVMDFSATELNGGTDPSYQWMVNGQPAGGNSAAFGSGQLNNGDVVVCELLPGAGACLSSAVQSNTVVAAVQPLPVVEIFPADTIVMMGGRVTLRSEISGDVVSYQWTPAGLLVDPQSATPETVALQDSVGFVLTATTAAGCSSSASAKIVVYRALAMPNAFTPNGDGVNDFFRIPASVTMTLTEFSVFDRWGTRVFETRDVGQGWDGWFGGHPAPAGVYVYVVVGKDLKGPVSAKGTVVLVR